MTKRHKLTVGEVRRAVRKDLHRSLDQLLNEPVVAPNGETIPKIDHLCVFAVAGFELAVAVSCNPPEEPPAARDQPPPVPIHAAGCSDPQCGGQCRAPLDAPALGVVR